MGYLCCYLTLQEILLYLLVCLALIPEPHAFTDG
jgi:hypothetical protein